MGDKLQSCFTGALNKYHEINHSLPEKIIVYRDGVGDGQLDAVAGHEVEQFYRAFEGFQTDYRRVYLIERLTLKDGRSGEIKSNFLKWWKRI